MYVYAFLINKNKENNYQPCFYIFLGKKRSKKQEIKYK